MLVHAFRMSVGQYPSYTVWALPYMRDTPSHVMACPSCTVVPTLYPCPGSPWPRPMPHAMLSTYLQFCRELGVDDTSEKYQRDPVNML